MADDNTDPAGTVLFLRVPPELHARVHARAAAVGVPVAEWARRVLMHALDEPIREYTAERVEKV